MCGLGGLVRAKKENKALKYLPVCCKKTKMQKLAEHKGKLPYTDAIFYVTNFH